MRRTQEASAHYFQRPDAQTYVRVDPTRRAMTGFTAQVRGGKRSGKHWLWGGGGSFESPDFELNDAGILGSADDISHWGHVTYRENTPGRLFHSYWAEVDWSSDWNFGGINTGREIDLYGNMTFKNFSSLTLQWARRPSTLSDDMTRGGPLMRKLGTQWVWLSANSPYGRSTQYGTSMEYDWSEEGGWFYALSLSYSRRIGSRVSLTVSPQWQGFRDPQAWYEKVDTGGPVATNGVRYVFATLRASELRLRMRLNYFFSPVLSLEVYAEPFAAGGNYTNLGELSEPRSSQLLTYTTSSPEARNYGDRSFRSNIVLRWEFARGSTAYLVWQRNRGEERELGRQVRLSSLGDAFGASGSDYVAFKLSYWIPVR